MSNTLRLETRAIRFAAVVLAGASSNCFSHDIEFILFFIFVAVRLLVVVVSIRWIHIIL